MNKKWIHFRQNALPVREKIFKSVREKPILNLKFSSNLHFVKLWRGIRKKNENCEPFEKKKNVKKFVVIYSKEILSLFELTIIQLLPKE